jgi:hypothetical protein
MRIFTIRLWLALPALFLALFALCSQAQGAQDRTAFDQSRLKLSILLPAGATATRREFPTYDEVVIALPGKAGELTIWTYSRRFHSAAELVAVVRRDTTWTGPRELREFGSIPGFLIGKSSDATGAKSEHRAVIDRPGFDWLYLVAVEAADDRSAKALMDVLGDLRSL